MKQPDIKIKYHFLYPKMKILSAESTSSFNSSFQNILVVLIKLQRKHITIDFILHFFKETHLQITFKTLFSFKSPAINVCIMT